MIAFTLWPLLPNNDTQIPCGYEPQQTPQETWLLGLCEPFQAVTEHCLFHQNKATSLKNRRGWQQKESVERRIKYEDRQQNCDDAISCSKQSCERPLFLVWILNGNMCTLVFTADKCHHATLESDWTRREWVLPTSEELSIGEERFRRVALRNWKRRLHSFK
jgi:hypothetical protein